MLASPSYAFYGQLYWDYDEFTVSDHCHYDEPWESSYETDNEYEWAVYDAKTEFNACAQNAYNDYVNDANDDIQTLIDLYSERNWNWYASLNNGDTYDGVPTICGDVPQFYGIKPFGNATQWQITMYNNQVRQYNAELQNYKNCVNNWINDVNADINTIKDEIRSAYTELQYEWKS